MFFQQFSLYTSEQSLNFLGSFSRIRRAEDNASLSELQVVAF